MYTLIILALIVVWAALGIGYFSILVATPSDAKHPFYSAILSGPAVWVIIIIFAIKEFKKS